MMRISRTAAIGVITAAALIAGGSGAAHAAAVPQASGGGCTYASAQGYRVGACISAQGTNDVMPDMYVTNLPNSTCVIFWDVFHNGSVAAHGSTSCAVGHVNLGTYGGGGSWFTEVTVYPPGSGNAVINDESQPENV